MFRSDRHAPRRLPLGPLALLLVATPALAVDTLGGGTQLGSGQQALLDRNQMSGTGFGTWIEAGAQPGAAFAELYDQDGIPRFLVEAQAFAVTSGPGEYWPHGVLEGDLLPYELYIVPTEIEPVGFIVGEWYMVGANRGFLQAVVVDADGRGAQIGSLQGSFELPPILIDPDLPPPPSEEASASAGGGGGGYVPLGRDLPYLGPFPAPGGDADTLASSLGSGQQVNPNLQLIPPYPAGGDEARRLGSGQAADGASELQSDQPIAGSAFGSLQPAAGSTGALGGGQQVNPDLHFLPPFPAGPSVQAAALGGGTEALGMEPRQDAGAPWSGSEGEGVPEGEDPRVGELHLHWWILLD